MIENVSTQLTVFHCLCPLPASRKGLRLPLRSALFGEGGRDWRPCCRADCIWMAVFINTLLKPKVSPLLVRPPDKSVLIEINYLL